jgi:hypothetical protein
MASTFANTARRGAASNRIDMPLAALAGLAVAFVFFVMPGGLLSQAVEASGLPQFLSAAQPPLGTKARALIALAAAIAAFATVFFLLRLLGRKDKSAPRRREEPESEAEDELAAPRLRRADVHPDAPARRPILAARELGEPVRREPATQPFWRPDDFPAEPEEETVETAEVEETEAVPETLDLGGPEIEILQPEACLPTASPAPPGEEPPPPPSLDDSTLPDLMMRLERGLARRLRQKGVFPAPEAAPVSDPEPVSEPAPIRAAEPAFAPEGDDRLRSAIENLQKMAARAR